MDAWALVDWDNTIRPGFVMIDWIDYLADHEMIQPSLAATMREHERSWRGGRLDYHGFIKNIISIYQHAEPAIDTQLLNDHARAFVAQDESFLTDVSVGSTLLQLFQALDINVHVVSGAPLVILYEYQRRHHCIRRVTGVSSENEAGNLFEFKRGVARMYAASPALFGIGDSETDIPLFEGSRHPIGINFSPTVLLEKGGMSVNTTADLVLSHEVRAQLSRYVNRCYDLR